MKELENKIKEVVKQYIGKPIALSGGIDSGLLAALIKPKFAITVELPEGIHNEIKYAKQIVKHLGLKHVVVKYNEDNFENELKTAVKAIGRPIPHFNILPLFHMYSRLNDMGEKEIVLGDGPDETMCGYARDLIINYLYKVYNFEAFKNYKPLINKILPLFEIAICNVTGLKNLPFTSTNASEAILRADIELMRPDMDDMSNGIAKHFGITNLRPYQDNKELDDFMKNLPIEEKIHDVEYGKYALRKIAEKYLPKEIIWRKEKVGGPLYPLNKKMGWDKIDGEFGKNQWLEYQNNILKK